MAGNRFFVSHEEAGADSFKGDKGAVTEFGNLEVTT